MGKEEDDVNPGQDPIASNQSMKIFKAAVRWTAARGIAKEEEWHFAASYARANRLLPLGITNKHAAIKGLPCLEESEAKAVAKESLLARGLLKTKKQQAASDNGTCLSFARPFYFKGKCKKWTSKICWRTGRRKGWKEQSAFWTRTWICMRFYQNLSCWKISTALHVERESPRTGTDRKRQMSIRILNANGAT